MSIDRHLVLVLAKMKEWVEVFRVVIEGWHHEFLREAERDDFPRQWRVEGLNSLYSIPFENY